MDEYDMERMVIVACSTLPQSRYYVNLHLFSVESQKYGRKGADLYRECNLILIASQSYSRSYDHKLPPNISFRITNTTTSTKLHDCLSLAFDLIIGFVMNPKGKQQVCTALLEHIIVFQFAACVFVMNSEQHPQLFLTEM